jgi:Tol biopolymer transport system component
MRVAATVSAMVIAAATALPCSAAVVPSATVRISVGNDGRQSNTDAWGLSLSANGRYASFAAESTLLPGGHKDQNGPRHTTLISAGRHATPANGNTAFFDISGNGRYVAYDSVATNLVPGDTNEASDVFVYDRVTRRTTRVTVARNGAQADGASYDPSISADGRRVSFSSVATNLVHGDTNHVDDVFVRDLATGRTTRGLGRQ